MYASVSNSCRLASGLLWLIVSPKLARRDISLLRKNSSHAAASVPKSTPLIVRNCRTHSSVLKSAAHASSGCFSGLSRSLSIKILCKSLLINFSKRVEEKHSTDLWTSLRKVDSFLHALSCLFSVSTIRGKVQYSTFSTAGLGYIPCPARQNLPIAGDSTHRIRWLSAACPVNSEFA